MELKLERIFKGDTYTIGKLYINNEYFCDTLEDKDRGLTSDMSLDEIKSIKIKGVTAIPTGTYSITLDVQSPKFSTYKQYAFCDGYLPRLIDVPGYEGVLIHIGNTDSDSDGCLLVGKNTVKGMVTNSTETFKKLYPILKEASDNNESITITIV